MFVHSKTRKRTQSKSPVRATKSAALATTNKKIFRSLPLSRNVGQYKTGFPKQMFMRHKYMQTFTSLPTIGGLAGVFLSVNGMFDPDNSGATTHQPMYFDQMTALYAKYVVLASTATFTFYPTANAGSAVVAGYIDDDAALSAASIESVAEQSSAQFRFISLNTAAHQFQQTNQIKLKWDAKKAFGGDVIDNNLLYAITSANPTEQQYFAFIGSTNSVTVNIIIEYSAQWFELRDNTS